MSRFLLCLLVCTALITSFSSETTAQAQKAPSDPDELVFRADFGFDNRITPGRWNPVRIWVSSGSRSVQGEIEIRYATDPTQEHRAVAPFTTTPGKIIPVDLLVCPYENTETLDVSLRPNRGKSPKPIRFFTRAFDPNKKNVLLSDPNEALVLSVGDTGIRHAFTTMNSRVALDPELQDQIRSLRNQVRQQNFEQLWNNYGRVVRIRNGDEPTHWGAYNAARLIVMRASDRELLAAGAFDQIILWVRSGGRLVLLADAPGSAWSFWFEDDFAFSPIQLAPPAVRPLPSEIGKTYQDLQADFDDAVSPSVALSAPSRRITLTESGRANGWRLAWVESPDSGDSTSGLLAEGPMGFGIITVVGVDPGKTSDVLSSLASGLVWQSAIRESVSDWQSNLQKTDVTAIWGGPVSSMSVANGAVVSSLVDFETAGRSMFGVIALGVLVLALFLGPIDAIVLKRLRLLHRSWFTAILWIALAGLVAFLAPGMIRSGPARVRQLQSVDIVQSSDANLGALKAETQVVGIFSNRSGATSLTPPTLESLTSGVSAITSPFARPSRIRSVFTTSQRLAEETAPSIPRGGAVERIRLNLWTFRTFLMQKPPIWTDEFIRGRVNRTSKQWEISLEGLPSTATVNRVLLQTAQGFHTTSDGQSSGEETNRWDGSALITARMRSPELWGPLDGAIERSRLWNSMQAPEFSPNSAMSLAGPDLRGLSVWRRVMSGRWACLYVEVTGMPATVGLEGWEVDGHRHAVLRILVPLDAADVVRPNMNFERRADD